VPLLLFDENLSPHLPRLVADLFAGGLHVRDVGLARADDSAVWEYAQNHELVIVTKDDDFRQRSFLYGAPPKVIWVHLGDRRTPRRGADATCQATNRVSVVKKVRLATAASLTTELTENGTRATEDYKSWG
jgi:predicted nuclease of predicted toxin-antitoxin system